VAHKLTHVCPTGAWTIHLVLIVCLKIVYDIIPGVSQETSWTLTNITYMFGSYIMFHYVRGVPFEFNGGAFDNLNMWEQIDDGAQYTPAKKFLLSVPIVLFLLSTHYTHYDLAYFIINFLAVLGVIIPKLPFVRLIRPCPISFRLFEASSADRSPAFPEPSDASWYFLWGSGRLTWLHARGVKKGVGGLCIWQNNQKEQTGVDRKCI
jgi:hypothetical protein